MNATDSKRNREVNWTRFQVGVIKLINKEKIRSVRQTIDYLLIHAGLGSFMRLDPKVNFCDVFDFFTLRVEKGEYYCDILEPKERRYEECIRWSERKLYGHFLTITYYGQT